jgi:hypothetical protein
MRSFYENSGFDKVSHTAGNISPHWTFDTASWHGRTELAAETLPKPGVQHYG